MTTYAVGNGFIVGKSSYFLRQAAPVEGLIVACDYVDARSAVQFSPEFWRVMKTPLRRFIIGTELTCSRLPTSEWATVWMRKRSSKRLYARSCSTSENFSSRESSQGGCSASHLNSLQGCTERDRNTLSVCRFSQVSCESKSLEAAAGRGYRASEDRATH